MKSLIFFLASLLIVVSGNTQQLVSRVAAGKTASYTDSKGQVWQPDAGFFTSATLSVICPTKTASGTETGLYKSARYGATKTPEMAYTFKNLAAGNYTVNLYFDDCSNLTTGQRDFSVQANGATVISNLDIIAAIGGPNKPLIKTFNVAVSSGQLVLTFVHGLKDNPQIAGIELFFVPPVDATPPSVSITVPSVAATLSSPTPVTVHATDNVAVQSLSATLDGAAITTNGMSMGPDYVFTSDLASLKAGGHTVTATATDAAGNAATATTNFVVAVNVSISITASPKPHSVSLTWGAVTGAAKYNVYRRLSSGAFGAILASATTLSFTDTTVANGVSYSYAVTTVDSNLAESVKSAEVPATIPVQ